MIECEATDSDEALKVAVVTPAVVESVPVPSVLAPSLKLTVPVGFPAPGATAATVAVKVTDWPNAEGFADETTVVVVAAGLTACDSAAEVLPLKLPSVL